VLMVKLINGVSTRKVTLGRSKVQIAVNDNLHQSILVTEEEIDLIDSFLGDRITAILDGQEEIANDN